MMVVAPWPCCPASRKGVRLHIASLRRRQNQNSKHGLHCMPMVHHEVGTIVSQGLTHSHWMALAESVRRSARKGHVARQWPSGCGKDRKAQGSEARCTQVWGGRPEQGEEGRRRGRQWTLCRNRTGWEPRQRGGGSLRLKPHPHLRGGPQPMIQKAVKHSQGHAAGGQPPNSGLPGFEGTCVLLSLGSKIKRDYWVLKSVYTCQNALCIWATPCPKGSQCRDLSAWDKLRHCTLVLVMYFLTVDGGGAVVATWNKHWKVHRFASSGTAGRFT